VRPPRRPFDIANCDIKALSFYRVSRNLISPGNRVSRILCSMLSVGTKDRRLSSGARLSRSAMTRDGALREVAANCGHLSPTFDITNCDIKPITYCLSMVRLFLWRSADHLDPILDPDNICLNLKSQFVTSSL
jgi:hypothetical protein